MRCTEVTANRWFSSSKRVALWAVWLLPLVMILSVPARPATAFQADAPLIELQPESPADEAMAVAAGLSTDTANTASAISAGNYHTCALTAAGGVKCWGDNWLGQLGDGTTTNRSEPVDVLGLTSGVVAVSAGALHTCAVTSDGRVKCWGMNWEGQLGDGTGGDGEAFSTSPVEVSGLSTQISAVAAGGNHTCVRTSTGAVMCWGANWSGQLGDGTTNGSLTPAPVSGLANGVIAIDVGGRHSCALTTAGAVKCWGDSGHGQLGNGKGGDGESFSSLPVNVSSLSRGISAISTGGSHGNDILEVSHPRRKMILGN